MYKFLIKRQKLENDVNASNIASSKAKLKSVPLNLSATRKFNYEFKCAMR